MSDLTMNRIEGTITWDKTMNSREWIKKIPYLKFPAGVIVKPIPPFAGALVRFFVSLENKPEFNVSVYLDGYEHLGFFGGHPYWEIFPDEEGSNSRFDLNAADTLIAAIMRSLDAQKSPTPRKPVANLDTL